MQPCINDMHVCVYIKFSDQGRTSHTIATIQLNTRIMPTAGPAQLACKCYCGEAPELIELWGVSPVYLSN